MKKIKSKRRSAIITIIISVLLLGIYGIVQAAKADNTSSLPNMPTFAPIAGNQILNNTYGSNINSNIQNVINYFLPAIKTTELVTTEPFASETVEMTVPEPTAEVPVTSAATGTSPVISTALKPTANASKPTPATSLQTISNSDNKKMIALTFDDGPSKYTEQILDVFVKNNCHATFCIVGYKIADYKEVIKKIAGHGSQVMSHTWNHKDLTKLSESEIKKELNDTNDAIFSVIGFRPKMYRPPYGYYSDAVIKVSKELGLTIVNWNIDPEDWKVKDPDAIYNSIISHVKDGCIIDCHDTYDSTLAAMKRLVPDLILKGYKLVTVEELLGLTTPGQVYFYKK